MGVSLRSLAAALLLAPACDDSTGSRPPAAVSDFGYPAVAPGTAIVTAQKDGVILRLGVTVR